jgi:hypothetical protein
MTTQAQIVALRKAHPSARPKQIAEMAGCGPEYACCAARRAGMPFGRSSRPGWTRPLKTPKHAHPLVRKLIDILNAEQTTLLEVAERAGICDGTITSWSRRHMPYLDTFEAALNVLDYELIVRKRAERGFTAAGARIQEAAE